MAHTGEEKYKVSLMLDSGAFTAWTRSEVLELQPYIDFCLANEKFLFSYVNLDVIPGKLDHKRTRDDVESSAKKSYDNQQIMKASGLTPIPVFHQGESFEWLRRMVNDGEDYIGISPADDMPKPEQFAWMDKCFTMLTDEQGRPYVKTHGFGVLNPWALQRYPWYCMTDAHKVLTRGGWKGRESINVGDEVLAFNDGVAKWETILEVPVFDVDTTINEIDNRTFSARITDNHRWRVRRNGDWVWKTTTELDSSCAIPRVAEKYVGPDSTIPNYLVELLAWFWTEGTIGRRKPVYKKDSVTIYQSNNKNPEKVTLIRKALLEAGEKFCESVDKRSNTISFELYGHVRDWLLATAPNKQLPMSILWLLSEEQLKLFVKISVMADGWYTQLKRCTTDAPSFSLSQKEGDLQRENLDVFRTACLLAGYPTSKETKLNTVTTSSVQWIYPGDKRIRTKKSAYKGKVWCVRVKSGAFFTECNGKIYVTGNSVDGTSWILSSGYGALILPSFNNGGAPDYLNPSRMFFSGIPRAGGSTQQFEGLPAAVRESIAKWLTNDCGITLEEARYDTASRRKGMLIYYEGLRQARGTRVRFKSRIADLTGDIREDLLDFKHPPYDELPFYIFMATFADRTRSRVLNACNVRHRLLSYYHIKDLPGVCERYVTTGGDDGTVGPRRPKANWSMAYQSFRRAAYVKYMNENFPEEIV